MNTYFLKIKQISLAILLFCAYLSAQSQINIGISGGLNLARQKSDLITDLGFASLGKSAINIEYRFFNKFSLGYELSFVQKGAKWKDIEFTDISGTTIANGKIIEKLNYFDNNTYFKYRLKTGKSSPYFISGVSYGKLLSGTSTMKSKDDFLVEGIKQHCIKKKADISPWEKNDFAILAGIGIEKLFKKSGFAFAELRYQYGLTNLNKANPTFAYYKNRNISMTLGYAFVFGGKEE
jgi:opacity protein-like surface antigen